LLSTYKSLCYVWPWARVYIYTPILVIVTYSSLFVLAST
jgi:hypothetical protein